VCVRVRDGGKTSNHETKQPFAAGASVRKGLKDSGRHVGARRPDDFDCIQQFSYCNTLFLNSGKFILETQLCTNSKPNPDSAPALLFYPCDLVRPSVVLALVAVGLKISYKNDSDKQD
jgi:hypothetical protein